MSEPAEETAGAVPEAIAPEAPAAEPKPAAEAKPAAKPAAAAAAAAPARPLPTPEDIAAWIHGAEAPLIGALFEGLTVARFDTLGLQIRKEELLPQHWQVIAEREVPNDLAFHRLPEVGGLRVRYKDRELSRRRIAPLRVAWRELGGRRPAVWQVPDLLAAMRRILEHKHPVDFYELLSATRDVWRGLDQPQGKEQLEILWACLALIRKNTKK